MVEIFDHLSFFLIIKFNYMNVGLSYYGSPTIYGNVSVIFPLQILQDEVGEFVVEVQTGVAAVNRVVLVGIEEHLVLLVGLVELRHEVDGILEMHVVVGRAVDEQVVALQLVGEEAG